MSTPAIDLYNEALDAIEANNLPTALEKIEASLTEDPKDTQTWQLYHAILTASGQEEKAAKALEKIGELGLSDVDELIMKAGKALADGKIGNAITHYEDAIELDDSRADLHVSYALALYEGEYKKDAVEASAKAIELDPESSGAQYARGRILRLTGNHEAALDHLTKATSLDNPPLLAHYERGMILSETGQLEEALKCFEIVLKQNPTDENAATAKAKITEAIEQSGNDKA